jgi:hypothetical protein
MCSPEVAPITGTIIGALRGAVPGLMVPLETKGCLGFFIEEFTASADPSV